VLSKKTYISIINLKLKWNMMYIQKQGVMILKKIVVSGERFFMKFRETLKYFEERAKEARAEIIPVEHNDEGLFQNNVKDASAIVVIDRKITASTIRLLTNCELLLALSVGYDCIEVDAATARGIPVSNLPSYCTDEVANHALTLLVSVSRKIHLLISETKKGNWDYNPAKPIYNFMGKNLGIVGFGRIGRALAPKASGLGMRIMAYDPYLSDDIFRLCGVRRVYELHELMRESDYISIHAPLTPETHHMINEETLELMKKTAVLVNTARGKIIDESALYDSLEEGDLSGAGLDVLGTEPMDPGIKLLNLQNIIITPHIAWYSEESFARSMAHAMDEVVSVLKGNRPRYIVNPAILSKKNTFV
jgi:D-3-phosphoglycerate dehydrogenase